MKAGGGSGYIEHSVSKNNASQVSHTWTFTQSSTCILKLYIGPIAKVPVSLPYFAFLVIPMTDTVQRRDVTIRALYFR